MSSSLRDLLQQIEQLRNSRALIFATNDQSHPPRYMEEKDVLAIYQCLRRMPPSNQLDLILHTGGGEIQAARKLVQLLRQKASKVNLLIPYKAHSAGTLISLGVDEVIMGEMAELSPVDPHISMRGVFSGSGPKSISAEEVRLFTTMAQDWFGVQTSEPDLLALVCEKIFPTTLTGFYRAVAQMRSLAEEMFADQRPELAAEERSRVIHHLIHDFHSHDATLNWRDAQAIGLCVQAATDEEDCLLWCVYEELNKIFSETAVSPPSSPNAAQPPIKQSTNALIADTDSLMKHLVQTVEYMQSGGQGGSMHVTLNAQWQTQPHPSDNNTQILAAPPSKV